MALWPMRSFDRDMDPMRDFDRFERRMLRGMDRFQRRMMPYWRDEDQSDLVIAGYYPSSSIQMCVCVDFGEMSNGDGTRYNETQKLGSTT
ncbi:hypothetical protein NECAME_05287 [Necator americanus]|uniref:Uncharacterized protein n=1 Tax=Necator americanus TaxID=51031 RepID=W2SIA7_NECAM|nr:hypothetical protein NECAME_05287 [Necator americanus]ETN69305.1 hypothetical protein NECAME_05287 [Necator americanus]